jgi:hypothetical protein
MAVLLIGFTFRRFILVSAGVEEYILLDLGRIPLIAGAIYFSLQELRRSE